MTPSFPSPQTIALLLLSHATQTHAAYRLAIQYSTQFISPVGKSLCASVLAVVAGSEKCLEYVECILEHLNEYVKVGMGSGTAMLGLIPAAIALLPGSGLSVDEAFRREWWYLFLSVFCGHASVAVASQAMATKWAETAKNSMKLRNKGVVKQSERATHRARAPKLDFAIVGTTHILLLLFATLLVAATIALAIVLGLQTVMTWACNHELLIAGYLGLRVLPGLLELALLTGLRKFIDTRPQMRAQSFKSFKRANQAMVLAIVIKGATLALWAEIWVHGTAVLSSTIMLDGSWAVLYLLGLPMLLAAENIVLKVAY